MKATIRLAAATALSCFLFSQASADEWRYENGIGPNHALNAGVKHFLEKLPETTEGEITGTHFFGSVLPVAEASGGLRDGVVDMAAIFTPFLPSEFPINGRFLADIPGMASTSVAMSGANTEFILLHCQPCLAEFMSQNQLPLVMHSNPTYQLLMGPGREIKDVSDLSGKKIRAGGSYFRAWIENFGGTAVSLPGPEILENLNSGIIDGAASTLADVASFQIDSLVKSVTMINLGAWHNTSLFGIRLDLWRGLSEEQRLALIDLAVEGQAVSAIAADTEDKRVLEEVFPERGIAVIEPSQELQEAHQKFQADQADQAGKRAESTLGIENGSELAQKLMAVAERWEELVKTIDASDPEAVKNLYIQEIYSKIDQANFGL